MDPKPQFLSLDTVRYALAKLWLTSCAVLLVILVSQTLGMIYRDHESEAFGWALPNIIPTVALILTALADTAVGASGEGAATTRVRKDFYRIAWGLSVFYLALLVGTLVLAQLKALYLEQKTDKTAIETLKMSSLWLAPVQGLVVAAISRLFLAKEPVEKAAPAAAEPADH